MENNPLENSRILLGVTGSIAAYKAADLASKLTQSGAIVKVIMTEAATKFISPLSFQSVTGQPAYTDSDLWGAQAHVLHVGLAHEAELLLIAPTTAQTMAKLASGSADDLLSLTALALGTGDGIPPLVIAPAMDAGMFSHAATQENVRILKERGVIFIGPEEGHLASGLVAKGRMSEPSDILSFVRTLLARHGPLAGKHIVVTAGATQEPLDPVRYLTNRSSGKQGYALAQSASDSGANVTLISGPSNLTPPAEIEFISVQTAEEMLAATLETCKNADALLMAAAVADFRPSQTRSHKIKKSTGAPTIELTSNADILKRINEQRQTTGSPKVMVGFAAESQDLLENAQAKLKAKNLDLIAANNISSQDAGFAVDTNRVTLIYADDNHEELPLMSKSDVAKVIIARITPLLS